LEVFDAIAQLRKRKALTHSSRDRSRKSQRLRLATRRSGFRWIVEKFRGWSDCNGEVERRFSNAQRWTSRPRGGHFAAMEEPELLAQEIRAFFRPLRANAR